MPEFDRLSTVVLAVVGLGSTMARAGADDPPCITMTTDDRHRAKMALTSAPSPHERGHTATVFLNDRDVPVASSKNGAKDAEHHELLATLMIEGAKLGNPELNRPALFNDNTKTLTGSPRRPIGRRPASISSSSLS